MYNTRVPNPWNLRTSASYSPLPYDSPGIYVWDSIAAWPGEQAAGITQLFSDPFTTDALIQAITYTGQFPQFIQANSTSSASSAPDPNNFSIAFNAPVKAGNGIVVAVFAYMEAQSNFVVTDSAGNTYGQHNLSTYATFGGPYWAYFSSIGVVGGATTVNIKTVGTGGGSTGAIINYTVAVMEYGGIVHGDAVSASFNLTINPPSFTSPLTVTSSQVNELLLVTLIDQNFIPLNNPQNLPEILTTSTPPQPLLVPPGIEHVNDKTLPVYSLNWPMSDCEEKNPCRKRYPLI